MPRMTVNTLAVQNRDKKTKNEALRKDDLIPAVYYGAGVEGSVSIALKRQDFVKAYRAIGSTGVVILQTPDGDKQALIHEFQIDPVTHTVLHADFLTVDAHKAVQVGVPIKFVGEAPAEENGIGILNRTLHEVEIEAIPSNIPSEIEVDISGIESLDHSILAGDLVLPEGVTLITDPEIAVLTVSHIREEEEEDSTDMDIDSIQATSEKGDKEEEGSDTE